MAKLELSRVLEAAHGSATLEDYERSILPLLQREIPCEQAFGVTKAGMSAVALGVDERVRSATAGRFEHYARELLPFASAAAENGGVGVDSEFFGEALKRTAHYREVMRPHSGQSTLIGYLSFRGKTMGSLIFGRSTPGFSSREQQALRDLLPALSLARAAFASSSSSGRAGVAPSVVERLSAREQELLSYLALGYTNPEIALACGTSFRTVRNQMSSLFRKLGASTRAEAVALSLRQ